MPEENINEQNQAGNQDQGQKETGGELLMQVLKVLGIIVAVAVLIVVIGFGLLVGFCALSMRN